VQWTLEKESPGSGESTTGAWAGMGRETSAKDVKRSVNAVLVFHDTHDGVLFHRGFFDAVLHGEFVDLFGCESAENVIE
jgi:hypothetical protein